MNGYDRAGYHSFIDDDGEPYGSFEVFYVNEAHPLYNFEQGTGWYWWPCSPGCLPDGDPVGPFATSEEALADAIDD